MFVLQLPRVGALVWSAKWSERGTWIAADGHVSFHSWQQTQGWWVRSQIFGVEGISSSCHSSVSNLKHLPETCALLLIHRWRQVKVDKHQLGHFPLVCSVLVTVLLLVAVRYVIRNQTVQCSPGCSVNRSKKTISLFYCKETRPIRSKLSVEWYSHLLTISIKDVCF